MDIAINLEPSSKRTNSAQLTMADFSTLNALETLFKSIAEWNNRLDELNGQIALRQIPAN
jgi:hypothetical protein